MTLTFQPSDAGLNLADIQGNILTAYGKSGFPTGRNLLLHVAAGRAAAGRTFLRALLPRVTTAVRWPSRKYGHFGAVEIPRPAATLNIAFTFWGLAALELPVRTLRDFPDEFIDGMSRRATILGDDLLGSPHDGWDAVWRNEHTSDKNVHILLMLNSQMDPATGRPVPALDALTQQIRALAAASEGAVTILAGHGQAGSDTQELSAIMTQVDGGYAPTPKEHFGFTDGVSNPVFQGQYPAKIEAERARGAGKFGKDGVWRPLATGEFLLGHTDEAQEIAGGYTLRAFARNGTFIAYRKLQENVARLDRWIAETAVRFGTVFGIADPEAARQTLRAKMVGRWIDGVPLSMAPDYAAWQNQHASSHDDFGHRADLSNYLYSDDPDGAKCPFSAHARRANPRDANGPLPADGLKPGPSGTILSNRRRLLRRALPYGARDWAAGEDGEHGVVMFIMCASLARQYEFVQQQWINYGNDNNAGNDTDPLLGQHGPTAKFVIPADDASGHGPFIADKIPQFVESKGGAYFFMPSLTALSMLGMGIIDPT